MACSPGIEAKTAVISEVLRCMAKASSFYIELPLVLRVVDVTN